MAIVDGFTTDAHPEIAEHVAWARESLDHSKRYGRKWFRPRQ
jgi:hypothetical protein